MGVRTEITEDSPTCKLNVEMLLFVTQPDGPFSNPMLSRDSLEELDLLKMQAISEMNNNPNFVTHVGEGFVRIASSGMYAV